MSVVFFFSTDVEFMRGGRDSGQREGGVFRVMLVCYEVGLNTRQDTSG